MGWGWARYAEKKGFTVRVAEMSPAEAYGIKSAMLEIEGENAFGMLSSEKGKATQGLPSLSMRRAGLT